MERLSRVKQWLDEQFDELLAESTVPGAAIAVLAGDEVVEHAAGVLNLRTGVEATTDSVFQIGSITKVWTATLTMQLVDEGLLDLDEPVRTYLPDFRVADEAAGAVITPRHLLTHTSGLEGDVFTEVGAGADAVERFVADLLPVVAQVFPPGELFSYSNTGFIVLGRVIEQLRGKPYNDVLLERLATPLGLHTVSPRAEDAILHRAAVGHLRSDGVWRPAETWARGYAGQPAGSMLAMSAGDLIAFAGAHLRGGRGSGGTEVLAKQSVEAMLVPHVLVPPLGDGVTRRALGWTVEEWPGGPVVGHDGGTIGQAAYLRVVPQQGIAIALLTNGQSNKLFRAVFGQVLTDLTGIELPPVPKPPEHPELPERADLGRYVGRYETRVTRFDIEADVNGELWSSFRLQGELAEMLEHNEIERDRIVRLNGADASDTFIAVERHNTFTFVGDDGTGRARYLHTGRALPRVG